MDIPVITLFSELALAVSRHGTTYFYGGGRVGRAALLFLRQYYPDVKARGVLVSPGRAHDSELCGVPVLTPDWAEELQSSFVIATVRSALREEIEASLREYGCVRYAFLDEELCLRLLMYLETRELAESLRQANLAGERLLRLTPQPRLEYVVVNILDHCNLNCRGCDHFASLAKPRLVPPETVAADVRRFAELMEGGVGRIGVMGGEPLLHPGLPDILKSVRESFPKARVQVDTNGILLPKQSEDFWKACREKDVVIVITKYPIPLDYGEIERLCSEKSVKFEYYGNSGEVVKDLYKLVMDPDGGQEPREAFMNCFHANNCNTLMEGKLYPCTVAPNAHIFNEAFDGHLELCGDDWLDIYAPSLTERDVLAFLARPIPFCRYCDTKRRSFGHPWGVSKKRKEEWTL